MFKVYKLDGVSGIIIILLLLVILLILTILLSPLFIGVILLILIYLGYRRFKKSIKEFIQNLKKKKIKIKNKSHNGEIEIHFAKPIPVEAEIQNENNKDNLKSNMQTPSNKNENKPMFDDNLETKQFIAYLVEKGFKFKDNLLYYNDKSVYPIYKKSYPINEIIRLYNEKPKTDIIVLGLKGEPYKPKFIYIIPIEDSKERMSIDELKNYLANI